MTYLCYLLVHHLTGKYVSSNEYSILTDNVSNSSFPDRTNIIVCFLDGIAIAALIVPGTLLVLILCFVIVAVKKKSLFKKQSKALFSFQHHDGEPQNIHF